MNSDLTFLHISGYRFTTIDDCEDCCDFLEECVSGTRIRGSMYVAPEGVNLMLAGSESEITGFTAALENDERFLDIPFHRTWSERPPFSKLIIKTRSELVPLERDDIDITQFQHQYLEPQTLKQWLDEGHEFYLMDMRNAFEYALGSFTQATHLNMNSFRLLKNKTAELKERVNNDRPVVTFCTGGIRCEKAGPFLEANGYKNVYQLRGGILNYLNTVGGDHWQGDCFVFDERVALNASLEPTYPRLCRICQIQMNTSDTTDICLHCQKDTERAQQSV